MQSQAVSAQTESRSKESVRLYYLDWLRVIAILGVFLFHAVHPFDLSDWHIKNAEQSMAVSVVLGLLFPWGMPFFFLIVGTGSWFALRRRTAGQYVGERTKRLLLPYITGCILLWPIMLYFQWRHILWNGSWYGSFLDFVLIHRAGFSPLWFGEVGFHLWFLGFLFCFSVLGLPIFLWLKGPVGAGGARPPGRVLFASRRNPAVHRAARTGPPDPAALLSAGTRLGRFLLPDGDLRVRLRAVRGRRIRACHPAGLGHPPHQRDPRLPQGGPTWP